MTVDQLKDFRISANRALGGLTADDTLKTRVLSTVLSADSQPLPATRLRRVVPALGAVLCVLALVLVLLDSAPSVTAVDQPRLTSVSAGRRHEGSSLPDDKKTSSFSEETKEVQLVLNGVSYVTRVEVSPVPSVTSSIGTMGDLSAFSDVFPDSARIYETNISGIIAVESGNAFVFLCPAAD